ncbi:hypothetical protein [Vibrio sp. WXL103]|uniref:hypothetical protein n=1 Tax=unclassified Vibrio TaxID=2614977 RepID=UPI003EC5D97F
MRPTTVRSSHSYRSAARRRSGFTSAPVAKKTAPSMSLVEQQARLAPTSAKQVKAA